MKKYKISMICLMLLSLITTCVFFMFMNDTVPTHIGIDGKPDQFGSKYFLLFLPLIMIIIGTIMLIVERFAKISENYKKYMLLTGIVIETVFLALSVVFSVYALLYVEETPAFDFSKVIMIIMGLMFIVLGNFMPKIEKNRTLGLKTYWSMYNEVTWQKTHRFVGFVSVISGIITLLSGILFEEMVNFIILMVLVLLLVGSSIIYSYIVYKKEKVKE